MKLSTILPVAHLFFKHWHTDDTEVGIVIVKARFAMHTDGKLYATPGAPELVMADAFAGDPATSALLAEQDIAPAKTGTDVTVRARAYAPGGEPLSDWPVSLSIANAQGEDILTWGFHVRGPVRWFRKRRGWAASQPEKVSDLPLDYSLAYGGTVMNAEGQPDAHCAENPAGVGFATAAALDGHDTWPAPQIGELADFLAGGDPTKPMNVRGFGPVAKTWSPRRAFAGTFDAAWEATRHPRMPRDYDLAFWNAAPTALQCRPALRGDEEISLDGLLPQTRPLKLVLPGVGIHLQMQGDQEADVIMTLDTVSIDVTEGPKIDLVWRTRIADPGAYDRATISPHKISPDPVLEKPEDSPETGA